jgi:hypothetical protein
MTVFIAQSILTVIAWPFMSLYTPVVGIPIALYAVASRCNKRLSLPALLISLIPNGLAATAAGLAAKQISTFVSSVVFLVLASIGAFIAGRLTQASHRHIEYLEREQAASREAQHLPCGDRDRLASIRSGSDHRYQCRAGQTVASEYRDYG